MTFCVQCGIRFLTHPRCAGRRDLRCPFGCREHHRKQRSNQRSTAYYQTPSGKRLKKRLNALRGCQSPSASDQPDEARQGSPAGSDERREGELPVKAQLRLEDLVLSPSTIGTSPMLPYVEMIARLLEGIHLRRHELLQLLLESLRQHSIASRTRTDYVLRFLHQHPP